MRCSLTDFDQNCDIVTQGPDRRTGPMLLRSAVKCVVTHRPFAATVEIELADGTRIEELSIEALFELASGSIYARSVGSREEALHPRIR